MQGWKDVRWGKGKCPQIKNTAAIHFQCKSNVKLIAAYIKNSTGVLGRVFYRCRIGKIRDGEDNTE